MRTPIHATLAAAAIALAAALIVACEHDVDPLAPSDGVIDLQANPGTVVLDQNDPFAPRDPESGLLFGTSNIYAKVFDKTGHPLGGIAVFFTTTGGRLASAVNPGQPPRAVITNPSGVATDTLTIKESDPTDNTVTASSSIVTKTVVVKRTSPDCRNVAPVANAGPDQTIQGEVLAVAVVLDGRSSADTETPTPELLFTWECGNGDEPVPAAGFQDVFPQVVSCSYEAGTGTENAVYTATLSVTDRGNGLVDPNTGDYVCKETVSDTVKITVEPAAR